MSPGFLLANNERREITRQYPYIIYTMGKAELMKSEGGKL
jgi:hypothetical protein